MKPIPLSEAIDFLNSTAAVIADDSYVTFPNLNGSDEAEEVFLILVRTKDSNEERFACAANANVPVNEHGKLVFVNVRGEKTTVALLGRGPVMCN